MLYLGPRLGVYMQPKNVCLPKKLLDQWGCFNKCAEAVLSSWFPWGELLFVYAAIFQLVLVHETIFWGLFVHTTNLHFVDNSINMCCGLLQPFPKSGALLCLRQILETKGSYVFSQPLQRQAATERYSEFVNTPWLKIAAGQMHNNIA